MSKTSLTPQPPLSPGEKGSQSQIQVEARLESDGRVTPLSVVWEGRRTPVADVGRQWTQEDNGVSQRHVLVMLPNNDRLELALNPIALSWSLVQSWTTPTHA